MSMEVKVPSANRVSKIPTPEEVAAAIPANTAAVACQEYIQDFRDAATHATLKPATNNLPARVVVSFPWPPEPLRPPLESSVEAAQRLIEGEGWKRQPDQPTGLRDARSLHVWASNL